MKWARMIPILVAAIASVALVYPASAQSLKPEDAYLSSQRSLNRYFGVSLEIPVDLKLSPTPLPLAQGAKRWLLALRAGSGVHMVMVMMVASTAPKKGHVAGALRSDFGDTWPEPGKAVRLEIGGQPFWKISDPAKPETDTANTIEYGGIVRDYLLTIRIHTDDGPIPDGFTDMVEHAAFVSPADVAARKTADMVAYAGPALPELGQPTPAIAALAAGTTTGRVYRNDALGISYHVPDGLEPASPLDVKEPQAWGGDTDPARARQIAVTCTRPLFVADDSTHPHDGHVAASAMITAIDPLCLQGARFPDSASDNAETEAIARALAEQVRLGRPGSSLSGRVYSVDNKVFLTLAGTVYGTDPGTGLKIPNRLRIIATQLSGYVVVWTFMAPDTATLERLATTLH